MKKRFFHERLPIMVPLNPSFVRVPCGGIEVRLTAAAETDGSRRK